MAHKDSYFRKHKEKIHEGVSTEARMAQVQVTDEVRAGFESGKVLLIDKPLHWTSFDAVRN